MRRAAALRKEGFDVAVIAKTSFRSAWNARLAGIPRRIGHATEQRSLFLTDPIPYERTAYYAFSLLDLARALLDSLRDGPKTTGELAHALPELTRFAVMQHLKVLDEANLVLSRRDGRSRQNYSNPAPLREMYERWVSGLASRAAETALQFKRYAETKEQNNPLNNFRDVQIETEIHVKASPQTCFDALTKNYHEWFPHRFRPDSIVFSESHLGGHNGERFAGGGGAIHATVLYVDEPHAITYGGPGAMLDGTSVRSAYTIEPTPDGAVVKRRMRFWGVVSEQFEAMFREGTRQMFESSFRNYVESGLRFEGGAL